MSNFVKILDVDQLNPGQVTTVTVKGRDVCIANLESEFFALDNKCPYQGGQLGDGQLQGVDVICPLHGWDFDVRTGISRYDHLDRVTTFPVRRINGYVEIGADGMGHITLFLLHKEAESEHSWAV